MLNKILLIGNLTKDPEGPRQAGSSNVTDFRIACSERWGPRDDQQRTLFIDVECWGRLAEVVAENLRKGRRVFVEGRLQMDEWEKDGERRTKMKVNATTVQFLDRPSDGEGDGQRDMYDDRDRRDDRRDDRRGGRGNNQRSGKSGGRQHVPDYGLDDNIPF